MNSARSDKSPLAMAKSKVSEGDKPTLSLDRLKVDNHKPIACSPIGNPRKVQNQESSTT